MSGTGWRRRLGGGGGHRPTIRATADTGWINRFASKPNLSGGWFLFAYLSHDDSGLMAVMGGDRICMEDDGKTATVSERRSDGS